jgi:hypothetical protein
MNTKQELIEQIYSIVTKLECKTLVRLDNISLVIFHNVLGDYGELLSKRDIYVYDNEVYLGSIYDECDGIYYNGFDTIEEKPLLKSIIEQLQTRQED